MKMEREQILKKRIAEILDELGYTTFFCAVGDGKKTTGWMGHKYAQNQNEMTREVINLLVSAMSAPEDPDDLARKLVRHIITEAVLFLAHKEGS